MEIISRLRIDGNENAYMIKDAELTYPIFAASLHAPEIFNQLITSGYKLCALPFDFRKDGASITSLPIKDYAPTPDEMQDMFDINSTPKMLQNELRNHLSVEDVTYLDEPESSYVYTTREEFLAYLRGFRTCRFDPVIYPINYFVHPNARFTMEEWKSGEFSDYFRIMEERRALTYQDYIKLRAWLMVYYPNAGNSYIDFVEAYNAWGIDGLNVRFMSKKRKTNLIHKDGYFDNTMGSDVLDISYNDMALVDKYGAIFPPTDITPGYKGWKVRYKGGTEDMAFRKIISRLQEGEYGVVPVMTNAEEEVIEYMSPRDTFEVSSHHIICGSLRMLNMSVRTVDETAANLPARWWSEKHDGRVRDMSFLRAVAASIIKQRKRYADVSTFKALMQLGCDIKGALSYVVDRTPKTTTGDDGVTEILDPTIPTLEDVNLYVTGNVDRDSLGGDAAARFEYLDDIVNGNINLHATADGAQADKATDVREIYQRLYCLHFCKPQIPLNELYALSQNVDTKVVKHTDATGYAEDVLPVQADNGFVMNITCPVLDAKVSGFNTDLKRYKADQANQCSGFLKVIQIAKEYGVAEADRHVAFEAQTVNLLADKKIALKNLEVLIEEFDKRLINVPSYMQRSYQEYKKMFCMKEYFRVAEEGCMKFDKNMGGDTVTFSQDFIYSVKSTIRTKITSTAVYCNLMYVEEMFTHFCVNADITPWQIYPTGNSKIPVASIYALWYDLNSMGAGQLLMNLANTGALYTPAFTAWTYRYINSNYFPYAEIPPVVDLVNYMSFCNKFTMDTKPTEEYTCAPHIENQMYGYYDAETTRNDTGVNVRDVNQKPSVCVSKGCVADNKTYPGHGPVEATIVRDIDPLKRFTGFSAEDFDMLGDVLKIELPENTGKFLIVEGDTIATDSQSDLPYYMIAQMENMGYPILRLWGRKYVFRDMYGNLWEVTA